MRRLATLAVLVALMSPTAASGYTFGDWARDHGYSPGDVMPSEVNANPHSPANDSLDGVDEFDWTTTPTEHLNLALNHLRNIASGDCDGLTDLRTLYLVRNQISNIGPGTGQGSSRYSCCAPESSLSGCDGRFD
jgi:hypothetical protein